MSLVIMSYPSKKEKKMGKFENLKSERKCDGTRLRNVDVDVGGYKITVT